ncbi:MAG TPA: LysM peptidoglycan-binding domain-containing protein [Candidatus Dormibacteraeota bacterium]|nr:LysM peptidoglycan-binding domain-containing protein [Candidatus Dormibacteraeota bacterium]
MYAVGHGIKPWRAPRAGGPRAVRRAIVVAGAVIAISLGLAVAAHGGSAPAYTTVVVQPGDTLWGIAAEHYPADDVRIRVQDIEHANGLPGPSIAVGQTLRLPG